VTPCAAQKVIPAANLADTAFVRPGGPAHAVPLEAPALLEEPAAGSSGDWSRLLHRGLGSNMSCRLQLGYIAVGRVCDPLSWDCQEWVGLQQHC